MSEREEMKEYNLVSFIEEYLESKGKSVDFSDDDAGATCCCPLPDHNEKSPSFSVLRNDDGEYWFNCMGCHTGGDIFKFVSIMDRTDNFREMLEIISDITGIEVKRKKVNKEFIEYTTLMGEYAREYTDNLYDELEDRDSDAYTYLKHRGFLRETKDKIDIIEEFGFGLVSEGAYDDIGVGDCDNRICLPLEAPTKGKEIVALCLRTMQDFTDPTGLKEKNARRREKGMKDVPKYTGTMNSGHVFYGEDIVVKTKGNGQKVYASRFDGIYKKNDYLYNFTRALPYIRQEREVIIVEGAFDTISLFIAGIRNVVSTLTCQISDNVIEMISKYTKSVILWYDNDEAGQRHIEDITKKFAIFGVTVRICSTQYGGDPDDYAKKLNYDSQEMKKLIKRSTFDAMIFILDKVIDAPSKKITAIQVDTIALINAKVNELCPNAEDKPFYKEKYKKRLGV